MIRFDATAEPDVSIVIPTIRRADLLDRCLRTLAQHRSASSFEVIVLMNGASQPVVDLLEREVEGARLLRSPVNLGFAAGCNRAAETARGELLVLLNDDAEVEEGWLDALVAAAEARPEAALVASLILFPDGTIQDAGGEIHEGLPRAAGRGEPADGTLATVPRQLGYASACGVLVRRSAWNDVGGMDERYFPAYFEDVDLCLRLRLAGWQLWIEPTARLRHAESASSDEALKRIAWDRNKALFLEVWDGERPKEDPTSHTGDRPTPAGRAHRQAELLPTELATFQRAADLHDAHVSMAMTWFTEARSQLADERNRREQAEVALAAADLARLEAVAEAYHAEQARAEAVWLADLARAATSDAEQRLAALRNLRTVRLALRVEDALDRRPRVARLLSGGRRRRQG